MSILSRAIFVSAVVAAFARTAAADDEMKTGLNLQAANLVLVPGDELSAPSVESSGNDLPGGLRKFAGLQAAEDVPKLVSSDGEPCAHS